MKRLKERMLKDAGDDIGNRMMENLFKINDYFSQIFKLQLILLK